MKKIKWGILGPGVIAHQFANDFKFVKNAELVAVASRSEERATAFASTFNIPKIYCSYEELYADNEIDAVYVATPHNFHFKMCADALKAGKAVLSEKPITVSSNELKELLVIAKKNNGYLVEGLWTYFLPTINKVKEWVDAGRIGNILHIKSDFGYAKPFDKEHRIYNPNLAGGAILDIGIYNLAMPWLFLKNDPVKMHIIAGKAPTGVENDVQMLFDYGGQTASLHCSFNCKLNNWTYVVGKKGYIAIHDFWRTKECFLYENEEVIDHFKDKEKGFGFNYEITAVSNDLLAGKKSSDKMPHSNSLKLQEQMEAILARIHQK